MVLLRCLSSWFLISKRNIQVHQKDTLDLSIHSSGLKALNDGGCLRLKQVLSRDNAFAAPSPPRDWHGGPFPTHGQLAQGLSLTMRPTRTASPLCFFLTAATRNLAIASFLFEYSGPFWGMFSNIRLDIYIYIYIPFFFKNWERSPFLKISG